jgi:hypothetical protein
MKGVRFLSVLCLLFVALFLVACSQPVLEEIRNDATSISVESTSVDDVLDEVEEVTDVDEDSVDDDKQAPLVEEETLVEPVDSLEDALGADVLTEAEEVLLGATQENIVIKTYTEGEFISLEPKGFDPDGDTIKFTYTEPLNEHGEWQTVVGDAGRYEVQVSATDGKSVVEQTVVLVIDASNNAPDIIVADVTAQEGDLITLSVEAIDEEGDAVTLSYDAPFDENGEWQTSYDDAGTYSITVVADDGTLRTQKEVKIVVKDANRSPVITNLETIKGITAIEGEQIEVQAIVEDVDGDEISIQYGAPLSIDGSWQTTIGDAGDYRADLVVTDGTAELLETLLIHVEPQNHAPSIAVIDDVTIEETDFFALEVAVSDEDGDTLDVTFGEPLNEDGEWQTDYQSEGVYAVTVTASDGKTIKTATFTLTVMDKNRPPTFSFE